MESVAIEVRKIKVVDIDSFVSRALSSYKGHDFEPDSDGDYWGDVECETDEIDFGGMTGIITMKVHVSGNCRCIYPGNNFCPPEYNEDEDLRCEELNLWIDGEEAEITNIDEIIAKIDKGL